MRPARRTTDYGTVVLHAALIIAFSVLVLTGLRIATDDPKSEWLSVFDPILPVEHLWYRHLLAGAALIAILAAYVVYLWRARLTARVGLDRGRLQAIVRGGRARWASLNVLVYWTLMVALAVEVVTGVFLFAGAGRLALDLHRDATFVCLGAIAAHVALHAASGGLAQLLRVFRPAPLHVALPPPDVAELLAEHLARHSPAVARPGGWPSQAVPPAMADKTATTPPVPPPAARPPRLQSNPLVSALAVASVAGGLLVGAEQVTRPTLRVVEIAASEAPKLDGDLSDPAWTRAVPVQVLTTQGGDFGGTHQSLVEVRALHDGDLAYFAFVWEDPTRSLKHLPLVKQGGRWLVAASREDLSDEGRYHEDKFAVLLLPSGLPLIGAAIHLARKPLPATPPSSTGRGLHYTDGSIADVWQWRASHSGPAGHIDNSHFGGPQPVMQPGQPARTDYAGGFAPDPAPLPYQSNIVELPAEGERHPVRPRRLPRDLAAMADAMGRLSDDARESEGEGARWWMTLAESVPYTPELDARIPDGTVVPGVIIADRLEDARTSIRGVARWAAGRWTLELARRLHTGSPYDIPIRSGALLWVGAFDHAEKRHTRHLRPFRLEVD